MGKVNAKQLLKVEDFPKDQRKWLAGMFYIVNRFINQVIGAVNSGIEFESNILGQEHDFDFEYVSDAVTLPLTVTWRLAKPPRAVSVVYASENGGPVIILVDWRFTQEQGIIFDHVVKIDPSVPSISALTAASRYTIRVRITP